MLQQSTSLTELHVHDQSGKSDWWSCQPSLFPMQCCLNGVQINKVSKFPVDSPSDTTHAKQLIDSLNATHLFIILLQLQGVTCYFGVHFSSDIEYANEEKPTIQFTGKESPLYPSIEKYSKKKD